MLFCELGSIDELTVLIVYVGVVVMSEKNNVLRLTNVFFEELGVSTVAVFDDCVGSSQVCD